MLLSVFLVCFAGFLSTEGRRVRLYQLIIVATQMFGLPVSILAMLKNVRYGDRAWFILILLTQLAMFICTMILMRY